MSPTVLFFFLHFNEIEQHFGDTLWLRHQISWFVGYISFSVVLFNYCLYLTGRRESGFIATFVHSIEGRLGNDSNLLIVFYVQIMPDDFVMQLHRF